jgi:hypothetical protein
MELVHCTVSGGLVNFERGTQERSL